MYLNRYYYYITDDDKMTTNGVEGSSGSKVNGAGSSDPVCGPSSSKTQNGGKKTVGPACFVSEDSEDDSEDEIFNPK